MDSQGVSTQPTHSGTPKELARASGRPYEVRVLKAHPSRTEVSDSEEERQRRIKQRRAALATVDQNELRVIVVSSDEEEEDSPSASVVAQKGSQASQTAAVLAAAAASLSREPEALSGSDSEDMPPVTPRKPSSRVRNVVLSSDCESEDAQEEYVDFDDTPAKRTPGKKRHPIDESDVIDLTLTSSESEGEKFAVSGPDNSTPTKNKLVRPVPQDAEKLVPLFLDNSGTDEDEAPRFNDPFSVDDGSILILNEPRIAQKPLRRPTAVGIGSIASPGPSTPHRGPAKAQRPLLPSSDSDSEDEVVAIAKPKPRRSTVAVAGVRSKSSSPAPSKLASKAPRMTKKALLQLELERRRAYADAVFKDLNNAVFGGGIPAETKLEWNKRLLTTAGRAHWHKSREGVHTTSIQLAEKILDCDERIRNTLSHEMCHLACWIIDDDPNENHGSLFKNWAKKVMRRRPEVEVTTRHSYEIKCKYEWKCSNCGKIYGRHSKSIKPEEDVCGVCKTGQLVPQFQTRSRAAPKTPKPKADSQNAAARSRDSPLHMPGAFPSPASVPAAAKARTGGVVRARVFLEIGDEDEREDLDATSELLADGLKAMQISTVDA
ncbi:SprT-like family-domain-containing protein [Fomes fomentarius]|nr:SprT-like family-domain-containing protein [Fomes fomentarius]